MARTWASVNVPLSEVPRCPDVPNDTGPSGGRRYAASSSSRSTSCAASGRVPAEGLTRRTMALRCAHAAADQPRRAVPRAGELPPDGPRRQRSRCSTPSTAPEGASAARELTRLLEERAPQLPPLRWRLAEVPFGLDHPYWVEEAEIDLGYHVREMALASPGTDAQLADQVARIMSRPLDRARPLWELYVIEGHESGLVAVLTKIHHAVIDGLSRRRDHGAAARPHARGPRGPAAGRRRPRRPAAVARCRCSGSGCSASRATRSGCCKALPKAIPNLEDTPFGIFPGVGTLSQVAGTLLRDGVQRPDLTAPKTHFSGRISPHRRFVFGQLPLERVQGGQEHARDDGQRRRRQRLRGRGAALAARARRPARDAAGRPGAGVGAHRRGVRHLRQPDPADGARRCTPTSRTRSSGCRRPTRRWRR